MVTKKSGFTLVELSIVLVILGLLVGGVLAGQSLIASAEMRSQMAQFEKFSTAAKTFMAKYDGLPGDVANAAAANLTARSGLRAHGDGNGVLTGCNWVEVNSPFGGENRLFWSDLSSQGLIEGVFTGVDCEPRNNDCAVANPRTVMPTAKLGNGNVITVYGDQLGKNHYQIVGGVTSIDATGALIGAVGAMTPTQAYRIDIKLDDGAPLTGSVVSARATTLQGSTCLPFDYIPPLNNTTWPPSEACISAAADSPYNLSSGETACSLRLPI